MQMDNGSSPALKVPRYNQLATYSDSMILLCRSARLSPCKTPRTPLLGGNIHPGGTAVYRLALSPFHPFTCSSFVAVAPVQVRVWVDRKIPTEAKNTLGAQAATRGDNIPFAPSAEKKFNTIQ